MKVCNNFIQKTDNTSATICRNCGCEKWEHSFPDSVHDKEIYKSYENPIAIYGGKGFMDYIKNMPSPFTMTDSEFSKTTSKRDFTIVLGEETKKLLEAALELKAEKLIKK